jgi:hypothetical protein
MSAFEVIKNCHFVPCIAKHFCGDTANIAGSAGNQNPHENSSAKMRKQDNTESRSRQAFPYKEYRVNRRETLIWNRQTLTMRFIYTPKDLT